MDMNDGQWPPSYAPVYKLVDCPCGKNDWEPYLFQLTADNFLPPIQVDRCKDCHEIAIERLVDED